MLRDFFLLFWVKISLLGGVGDYSKFYNYNYVNGWQLFKMM